MWTQRDGVTPYKPFVNNLKMPPWAGPSWAPMRTRTMRCRDERVNGLAACRELTRENLCARACWWFTPRASARCEVASPALRPAPRHEACLADGIQAFALNSPPRSLLV
jgi:hypothetical protein